ncbi:Topless family [Trema orientale]|uniref:Topless family n=1 Tax=Trema orientale TaxID=63057 RepID=A0A2P5DYA3_TREOI|nr:Topless family [Trema orientale]
MDREDQLLLTLIHKFVVKHNCNETAHQLERETGFFFDMRYFEECVSNGEWDKVENYLSGFIKCDDKNPASLILFEIREQKYLEACNRQEDPKTLEILKEDMESVAPLRMLSPTRIPFDRDNEEQLPIYIGTESVLPLNLNTSVQENPPFHEKLQSRDNEEQLPIYIGTESVLPLNLNTSVQENPPFHEKLQSRDSEEQLPMNVDTKSARAVLLRRLKKLIQEDPLFRGKLPPYTPLVSHLPIIYR